MARRGWGRSIFLAALAAAGTAAAQLGLGYGLGIVVWVPDQPRGPRTPPGLRVWPGRCGSPPRRWWSVRSSATGSAGNVHSGRVPASASAPHHRRWPPRSAGWSPFRWSRSRPSRCGSSTTSPRTCWPASTPRPGSSSGCSSHCWRWRPARSRPTSSPPPASSGSWPSWRSSDAGGRTEVTQLGMWKFTREGPVWHSFYIPGALLMLGGALMIGGLAAFPAAGRGESRVGVTVSGGMGPILVAVAYTLAAPRPATPPFEQMSAFYTSPYMIIAGLARLGPGRRRRCGSRPPGQGGRATTTAPSQPRQPVADRADADATRAAAPALATGPHTPSAGRRRRRCRPPRPRRSPRRPACRPESRHPMPEELAQTQRRRSAGPAGPSPSSNAPAFAEHRPRSGAATPRRRPGSAGGVSGEASAAAMS